MLDQIIPVNDCKKLFLDRHLSDAERFAELWKACTPSLHDYLERKDIRSVRDRDEVIAWTWQRACQVAEPPKNFMDFLNCLWAALRIEVDLYDRRRNRYLSRKPVCQRPGKALNKAEHELFKCRPKTAGASYQQQSSDLGWEVIRQQKRYMDNFYRKHDVGHAEHRQALQDARRHRDEIANNRRLIAEFHALQQLRDEKPDWYEAIWLKHYSRCPNELTNKEVAAEMNRSYDTVQSWLEKCKIDRATGKRSGGRALVWLAEAIEGHVETLEQLDIEIPIGPLKFKLPLPESRITLTQASGDQSKQPEVQLVTAI
jgi:hypothetical protein